MRFWKEPLVQFLGLGGVLFFAFSAFAPEVEPRRAEIIVDASRVQSLERSFEATWKRPPTASERQGLIEDFLTEEVFYREAQTLGLDEDDVVIRRRMRQKIEFLLQDGIAQALPEEDVLRAYFENNPARYSESSRVTFRQIYLGESSASEEQTNLLLARLNEADPPDTQTLGQRTMLPASLTSAATVEIDGLFGSGFGQQLLDLPKQGWVGPIRSGFGEHLIFVDDVIPSPTADFEDVRATVMQDFQYERQRTATKALVERLKQKYEIVVDEVVQ